MKLCLWILKLLYLGSEKISRILKLEIEMFELYDFVGIKLKYLIDNKGLYIFFKSFLGY